MVLASGLVQPAPVQVVLTDGDPAALANLKHNICVNNGSSGNGSGKASGQIQAKLLDWAQFSKTMATAAATVQGSESGSCADPNMDPDPELFVCDVLLGSDITYDLDVLPCLVETIRRILYHSTEKLRRQREGKDCGGAASNPEEAPRPVCFLTAVPRNQETIDTFVALVRQTKLSGDGSGGERLKMANPIELSHSSRDHPATGNVAEHRSQKVLLFEITT